MNAVVHLVRHAEVANPDGVLYGRLPGFGLSELGQRMARQVAGEFAGAQLTLLACSPLERAVQTAEAIAEACPARIVTDERLLESANRLEGRRVASARALLGDPASWWLLRNPLRPSWGEPFTEVAARMLAACAAAARLGGQSVLVSHQLPIWVARRRLEGRRLAHRPDRRLCALASITSLDYRDGRVVAITYREPAGRLAAGPAPSGA
jgi:broad specificity phosphatase PhoE